MAFTNSTPPRSSEATHELITREDRDGIATLTIDRPEKLNALNPAVFVALNSHLESLEGSDGVRCVVVRGAGRGFCAGHDLDSISKRERAPSKYYEAEAIDRLAALPIPTIAQVHGVCLTGGLELALACDLLIAATTAKLGDTHSKWGLVPAWGMSVRLPERVGLSKAKELMYTSRVIDGVTAEAIGLVDRCVAEGELADTVNELAREIASQSAGTNRVVKRLLADSSTLTPAERLGHERSFHYGIPADMRERLTAGGR